MNRSFLKIAVIGSIAALALGTRAFALPITGNLDFSGGAMLNGSLATATQVNSWGVVTVSVPNGVTPGSVLDSTINPGDTVTMTGPWVFGSGKTSLWSVGGFTFDLLTSSIALQNSSFINVSGTGRISGNGYDSTIGNWYFTSQGSSMNDNTFSFSATTVATSSVPDGGTTALLLGLGLTGLAFLGRTHRKLV